MITEHSGIFHICTETYSYLFKINAWGIPEHLHFGAPVQQDDAQALSCRPGLGWGCSILLDGENTASSLDTMSFQHDVQAAPSLSQGKTVHKRAPRLHR